MHMLSLGKVWYQALRGLLGICKASRPVYNEADETLAAWGEVFLPFTAVSKWWKGSRLFYVYKIAAFLLPCFLFLNRYCSCSRKNPAQCSWGKGTSLVFLLALLLHVAKSGLTNQSQWHCSLI